MYICLRRLLPGVAAMVAILAVGMDTPARAGSLQIWISTTHNPPVAADMVASGTTNASFSGTIGGDAIVNLVAGTNSPGAGGIALLLGSDLSITDTGTGNVTLFITMGSTGFTTPVTPPNILFLSHIGGSVPFGDTANTMTYQSYVDSGNGQNVLGALTTGAQTPNVTGGAFDSSASPVTITSLTGTYSVTQYYAITLSAGSELNFAASTTLTNNAVPEPSSLVLGGIAVVGMIGYRVRRRMALGA